MYAQQGHGPWWAALTVWGIVNAVNVLQAVGFLARIRSGSMALNHRLGYVMFALAAPALLALIAFIRSRTAAFDYVGLIVYLAFLALMLAVDYIAPVEFRAPIRYGILVPYLVLFFGSILLMGLPMYKIDRGYWLVTVVTSLALVGSMVAAMRQGVG